MMVSFRFHVILTSWSSSVCSSSSPSFHSTVSSLSSKSSPRLWTMLLCSGGIWLVRSINSYLLWKSKSSCECCALCLHNSSVSSSLELLVSLWTVFVLWISLGGERNLCEVLGVSKLKPLWETSSIPLILWASVVTCLWKTLNITFID